jgi:hypothetical protein
VQDARAHPHGELRRNAAMIWFFIFGLLNAVFVLRAFPARPVCGERRIAPPNPDVFTYNFFT